MCYVCVCEDKRVQYIYTYGDGIYCRLYLEDAYLNKTCLKYLPQTIGKNWYTTQ